jgi:hypothetical protein
MTLTLQTIISLIIKDYKKFCILSSKDFPMPSVQTILLYCSEMFVIFLKVSTNMGQYVILMKMEF